MQPPTDSSGFQLCSVRAHHLWISVSVSHILPSFLHQCPTDSSLLFPHRFWIWSSQLGPGWMAEFLTLHPHTVASYVCDLRMEPLSWKVTILASLSSSDLAITKQTSDFLKKCLYCAMKIGEYSFLHLSQGGLVPLCWKLSMVWVVFPWFMAILHSVMPNTLHPGNKTSHTIQPPATFPSVIFQLMEQCYVSLLLGVIHFSKVKPSTQPTLLRDLSHAC